MSEWIDRVPAVIEAWYPGMEGGHAITNILFGDINPSGKLPITFPQSLATCSAHTSKQSFPGVDLVTSYNEGIFVGYRHFEKKNISPLFPFGFGLSFTTFNYSDLTINNQKLSKNSKIMVSVDIANTGDVSGGEIVQIYSKSHESKVVRPPKELVGFFKVFLKPSETQTIHIPVKRKDFGYYDVISHNWKIDKGIYELMVGSSSRDIALKGELNI